MPAGRPLTRRILDWLAVHLFGGVILPFLVWTWRLELVEAEPIERLLDQGQKFVLLFWHNRQLGLIRLQRHYRFPTRVIVSRHGDGELIARVVERFGIGAVRGSSTRGGAAALREALRVARRENVGITPDGPVGPRYRLKAGAVQLGALSGNPVLCLCWSTSRAWQFGSWDHFLLPKPFATLRVRAEGPIHLPRGLEGAELERVRLEIQHRMNRLTADLDAETGREIDPALLSPDG